MSLKLQSTSTGVMRVVECFQTSTRLQGLCGGFKSPPVPLQTRLARENHIMSSSSMTRRVEQGLFMISSHDP